MCTPLTLNARILVVDDHPIVRVGFVDRISKQDGFAVCAEAEDEAGALEAALTHQPDVIVLDISLRVGNGIQLIPRLKKLCPAVKILIASMYDDAPRVEGAIKAGADGYISKREAATNIIHAISTLIEGKTYLSKESAKQIRYSVEDRRFQTVSSELLSRLTPREMETFRLLGKKLQPKEIGEALNISPKTVDTYRAHLREKLGIFEPKELLRCAERWVEQNDADRKPSTQN